MKQRILPLLLLLCICCQTFGRNFYNPSLCSDGSSTNESAVSCSQQLNKDNKDACTVQATHVCHKNVKIDNSKPLVQEKDASFSFNMVPYPHTRVQDLAPTLGLNISFQTSDPDLTGFYFFIIQQTNRKSYNSCRVFDFQKAREDIEAPVTDVSLYYDCYKRMEEFGILTYNVIVRAVPSNEELVYKVLLPSPLTTAGSESCQWSTLTMVNSLGLERNIVELKFTPANFTADFYLIQLKNSDSLVAYAKNVSATEVDKMISATFEYVSNGQYTIFIIPNAKNECVLSDKMDIFVLGLNGIFNHHWVFAFIICGCIIAVVLLGVIMHKICHRIGRNDSDRMQNLPKPKGLVLYSFDCPRHMDVVLKLTEYLKSCCNMDIMIDELDQGRQLTVNWIQECLADVRFVVVVISQGIKHKVDYKNNPPMDEDSSFGDRFTPALNLVLNKAGSSVIDNEHNQCPNGPGSFQVLKVYFDYSRSFVPRTLQIFKSGTPFLLMSQMNQFLCQIHCQQSKTFPIKIYPKMPGSDFMTNAKGKELVKAIEDMKAFQKEDPLWFKKTLRNQAIDVEDAVGSSVGATLGQVKEEDESIEGLQENDENGKMIQLTVEDIRKPSPSNSKKSVTICLEENIAESEESQELLDEVKVEDEKV